jgi:subtilase family serine protease
MDQLAHEIYDSHSPRYHKFMSKQEYQNLFAPQPEIKQAIKQYFIGYGMNAEVVYDAVRVTGTVKQVEQ